MPTREKDGKLVFNIVFYGPVSAGKKTMTEYLTRKEGSLLDNQYAYVSRVSNVLFRILPVDSQKSLNQKNQAKLMAADAIIYVWDSQLNMWGRSLWSLRNLIQICGDNLIPASNLEVGKVPIVVVANKRDLENIVEIAKIRQVVDIVYFSHSLIYEVIGTQGINVRRAFVYATRQAVLLHYKELSVEFSELKEEVESVSPVYNLEEIDKKLQGLKRVESVPPRFVIYSGEKYEIKEGQLNLSGLNISSLTQIDNLENIKKYVTNLNLSNNKINGSAPLLPYVLPENDSYKNYLPQLVWS